MAVEAPLVSLSEQYGVALAGPDWPVVYPCDAIDQRYVPREVRSAGSHWRHVLYWKPGDIQFWWQASMDGEVWYYVCRTDV